MRLHAYSCPRCHWEPVRPRTWYAERQGIGTVATPLDLRRSDRPDAASSDMIAWVPGVQQARQVAMLAATSSRVNGLRRLLSLIPAALETSRHLVTIPPAFQLPGRGVF